MENRLNIPVPPKTMVKGRRSTLSARTIGCVRGAMRQADRQIRQHNARLQLRGIFGGTDSVAQRFQEIDSNR